MDITKNLRKNFVILKPGKENKFVLIKATGNNISLEKSNFKQIVEDPTL